MIGVLSSERGKSRGFVLPLALLVIAIMAMALWSAAATLESTAGALRDAESRSVLEIASASTEARVGYLMATQPFGPQGLRLGGRRISREEMLGFVRTAPDAQELRKDTVLYFDGRAYAPPPEVVSTPEALIVRLQDRAGLFNLNVADEDAIARFLTVWDVAPERARNMAGALADYVDDDSLRRLRGAEADVYERRGLAPPLNDWLRAPEEALGALGWGDGLTSDQRAAVLEHSFAALRNAPQNLNTASEAVLRGWFAISEEEAARAVAARSATAFVSVSAFGDAIGRVLPEEEFRGYIFPSDTIRLRLERRVGSCLQSEVWIRLASEGAPRPLYFHHRLVKRCRGSMVEADNVEGRTPFPGGPGLSGF